ncbi:CerR family C-terminal domain-containing protein [Massilia endophytica]|uniref:CerR family C-terminal domain-containing protein n=1 Tax=Massilia endophytica TaxID=2899220 RepID=UPI001E5E2D19|nr:CerR family C-terminal domain-containing protein [Massilia endophytica]UGQ45423.1 CerR family C-terminal domain-containing protein [Massilia endophytica]
MAAMRLFAEQGFARTSTREIALAAGANVAAISYYFGDKAGIYRAALTDLIPPPEQNIELFDQPHFTLREMLEGFYTQMLAPLAEGELAVLCMRMWMREMVEPTGMWTREIEVGIKPEHMALVRVLARYLGVTPDEETHRLAYSVAGLALQLMLVRDVIGSITPQLLNAPDAIAQWTTRLADYAEAMILAEQKKLREGKL